MIAIRKSKPPLPLTKCPLVEDNGFSTPDSNLLKAVKPGDKVKFDAERINGQLVITKIEPTKTAQPMTVL